MKSRLPISPMMGILLILMSTGTPSSRAQTAVNWIGASSGNWSTSSDWSGGVVPNNGGGNTYNVTINPSSDQTISLNLGATVSDLTLGSAMLQSVAGDSLTIANGGNLTVNSGGTVLFNTAGSNITVNSGGTFSNSGMFDLESAGETLSVTGTTTNAAGATLTIEGGSSAILTGNVNNSGTFETGFSGGSNTVTVSGTFTNNSGATLELQGNGDVMKVSAFSNAGTLSLASGTTLTITGGGNGVTDVVAGSTYTIGGAFNVQNGSNTTSGLAKLNSVEGTLTLSNAQITTVTPGSGTLSVSTTGNVSIDSPSGSAATTLSITGNLNNAGRITTGFSGGSNTVNVSGTFTNAAGATMIMYSSTDSLNVNALSNSGMLQIGDGAASGATLTITGGGQGVTDIDAGSTLDLYGSLNVKNGGTTTSGLSHLTSVEGTFDLENSQSTAVTPNGGTLAISSTGNFGVDSPAGSGVTTLSITGNVSNSGKFTTGFSGGANTVNVSGIFTNAAGSQLILYSNNDAVNVNVLSNSGILQIGNAAGSTATLTITGGGQGLTDLVAGSTLALYGNLNVKNGGTTSSGLAHLTSVEGSLYFYNGQSTTVTPNSGTLTIAGTGIVEVDDVTTLAIAGNVSNSGAFTEGFEGASNNVSVSGTFTNTSGSQLNIEGSGDVFKVGTLTNSCTVNITPNVVTTPAILVITGSGTLSNSGNINIPVGTLVFNSSSATLTGSGTVTLGNSSATTTGTIQVGSSDTGTLTNAGNTITGYGNLGNGVLTLVNQGVINANGRITSGAFTVQPNSSGMTNTGTLEATNQGTLILEGTFNNADGSIKAIGETGGTVDATVELTSGTVINGGTLTTTTVGSNSGIIEGTGAVTLNGITNSGAYAVNTGTTTTLDGTVTNTGSITLTGSTLSIANSVTLNGKGTVLLSNSASNLITGATSALTFTSANTIQGSGTISNLGIVNTGTISANQSTPLIILPSSAGLNNKGTLSVSVADTMQIGTSAGGALLNYSGATLTGGTYTVSGTLEFGASGTSIVTDAANITLIGSSAKMIDFASQNVLTDLASISSAGSFTLESGANFTTAGNFTNNGSLIVYPGSKFAITGTLSNFNSSTDTLTGGLYGVGGKLSFAGANIVTDAANIVLASTGEIVNSTNNSNGLANLATISKGASLTLEDNAKFTTVGNLTANGKLIIDSGSTLTIAGTLTNFNSSTNTLSSGAYTIGGTMEFTGANIVTNATNLTIEGPSAKILNGTANGLANFANNTGSFAVDGNGNFTTGSSAFTNSNFVTVTAGSSMTVGGGNTYTQSAGLTAVDGTLAGSAINVTGGTILGAGKLSGNLTLGGSGTAPTVSAGDSGKAGLLAITGTYTQLSTGAMNVFIGGTTVGSQYSQMQVSGTASLAGTLKVTLASGFTPTIGSTFTVLTASTLTGTFSNSTIAINGSEHFNVSYTSTGVVLTVASGAPSQSIGLSQPVLAAAPTKRPAITTGVLHWTGTTPRSGFLVASSEAMHPHSGVVVGRELSLIENLNHPAAEMHHGWRYKPLIATPVAKLQSDPVFAAHSAPLADSWSAAARSVSTARLPAATSIRRVPVTTMHPMLPRVGR